MSQETRASSPDLLELHAGSMAQGLPSGFLQGDPTPHASKALRDAIREKAGARIDLDTSSRMDTDTNNEGGPSVPQVPWSAQVPGREPAPLATLPLTVPEHLRGMVEAARN